ncbi:universal stress protein [Flagellimonas flava]|uniref:Universal stress protein family protein n=1 Tax=Flagellimonas flava TaxID=570519 RepID=A0A1M5IRQ2_9FLAO|nr:universal stress protein [Allomuricauda flava]SHG31014.1 Universal stress protein family protein [Allomuricauda flava]
MKSTDTTTKKKISVIADISANLENVIANATELAKAIKGTVEVLYVKAPTDIVKGDNQLSAMRTLHRDTRDTESKLRSAVEKFSSKTGSKVTYKIAYGNTKNTIKAYLEKEQPHTVVLGKPKSKFPGIPASGIPSFIMTACDANVLVTGDDQKLHTFEDISLGVYGNSFEDTTSGVLADLNKKTSKPVRLFSVRSEQDAVSNEENKVQDAVSYVFTEGANVLDGLASYVKRTNTQLFCIPRKSTKESYLQSDRARQIVQKLDVPVLIVA